MGSMGRRPSARASSVRDLLRSGYCCPIRKNKYWQYMSNARWKPEIVLSYRMRQHFFKFWFMASRGRHVGNRCRGFSYQFSDTDALVQVPIRGSALEAK